MTATFKRQHLEVEFTHADTSKDGQVTICEFVRYIGRDGRLNVVPEAMAETVGYELPAGMEFVREDAPPPPAAKGASPAKEKPTNATGGNFLSAQKAKQAGGAGVSQPPPQKGKTPPKEKGPKKTFMNRMMDKAYKAVDDAEHFYEGDTGALPDKASFQANQARAEAEAAAKEVQKAKNSAVSFQQSMAGKPTAKATPAAAPGAGFGSLHGRQEGQYEDATRGRCG